ncbi:MAG: hypothetical protein AAFZ80_12540, partial [Cyanobacteria bacterium P01_A01_bin.105]
MDEPENNFRRLLSSKLGRVGLAGNVAERITAGPQSILSEFMQIVTSVLEKSGLFSPARYFFEPYRCLKQAHRK